MNFNLNEAVKGKALPIAAAAVAIVLGCGGFAIANDYVTQSQDAGAKKAEVKDEAVSNYGTSDYGVVEGVDDAASNYGTAGTTDYGTTDYGTTDYGTTDYGTAPAAAATDYDDPASDYGTTDYNDPASDYGVSNYSDPASDYDDPASDYGDSDYDD